MDRKPNLLLWALLAISTVTLALGAFALRTEAEATALGSGSTRLPQFVDMLSSDVTLPLSAQGRRLLLDSCDKAMQTSAPLVLRFASEAQRQMIVPFCTDLAQAAVETSGADSYAWLVLAMAQIRQGSVAEAERSIIWSAHTGPTESWIAEPRFELIQDHYDQFPSTVRAIGDADAVLLLPGNRGAVVAHRYVLDPAFRQRAQELIEKQPEAVQRRFVLLLRRQT